MTLSSLLPFLPLVIILIDMPIMFICLKKIGNQRYFRLYNKNIWMFIVVFGSFLGQLLYIVVENKGNYY